MKILQLSILTLSLIVAGAVCMPTVSAQTQEYDVYILNEMGYWKNGVFNETAHPDAYTDATFRDITVNGNDVYLAGTKYRYQYGEHYSPIYCKNGEFTDLNSMGLDAEHIEVQGDIIYIAGKPCNRLASSADKHSIYLWKNGQETQCNYDALFGENDWDFVSGVATTNTSQSTGIVVVDNDVYISGGLFSGVYNHPFSMNYGYASLGFFYENGEPTAFDGGFYVGSNGITNRHGTFIRCITKSDNDIYYAGFSTIQQINNIHTNGSVTYYYPPQITYWKNGVEKHTLGGASETGGVVGEALDIKVVNNNVYVLAYACDLIEVPPPSNYICKYEYQNPRLSIFINGIETYQLENYNFDNMRPAYLPPYGWGDPNTYYNAHIYDKSIYVGSQKSMSVTDNGDIYVVGYYEEYNSSSIGSGPTNTTPKLWNNGEWTDLPIPQVQDFFTGRANKVIAVPRNVSDISDANLFNISVSSGSLSPAFNSTHYSYTVNVANNVSSINITATPVNPNATVSGDTSSQALVVGANPFTITVTAEDGQTTQNYTVTVTRSGETGISETETETGKINIYPNPTTGELKIESGDLNVESVEIVDITGRIVGTYRIHTENTTINVSQLQPGVYVLKIGNYTGRFVKE